MQEGISKKTVSQPHNIVTTETGNVSGLFSTKAATQKKSQLQKALEEFSELGDNKSAPKKSLLSDESDVLQVGNEKRGTIIKDTKHKRWSFTTAMKNSVGGWFKTKKSKIESKFKKPIPKKVIEASSTRTQVIKKAAQMGAIAGTDSMMKTVEKKPIPKASHSFIRIKQKDVPKEIGDTMPRWTHIIEDKTQVVSQIEKPNQKSNANESELVTNPKEHTIPHSDSKLIKFETTKNDYRIPPVPRKVTPTTLTQIDKNMGVVNKSVNIAEVIKTEINTNAEEQETTSKEAVKQVVDQEENETSSETAPQKVVGELEHVPQIKSPQNPSYKEPSTLATSTIIMIALFITVIAVSTFSWNTIEIRNDAFVEKNAEVTKTNLVQADQTIPLNITSDFLNNEIHNIVAKNTGFTRFEITPSETLVKNISSWQGNLALGIESVEIGALNSNTFFVIKTSSRETGLVSMLILEANMPSELTKLYNVSDSSRFSSRKINNYDVRVLGGQTTSEFLYAVRNDGLILIAKNPDDLATIIDRVK